MAKRDFAKSQSQAENGRSAKKRHPPAAMVVISLLLTAGIAFMAGNMFGDQKNTPSDALKSENNGLKTQLSEQHRQLMIAQEKLALLQADADKERQGKQQPEASKQVGDLTFYSVLPKQKVMPAPLGDTGPAAKMSAPPHTPAAHTSSQHKLPSSLPSGQADAGVATEARRSANISTYHLQVGSYIRRSDAEVFLNRLAAKELSAQIREKEIAGIGRRYRVVMGPFAGLAAAEAVKSQVREQLNMNGLLLRE
ncbi:MAG: SPOR domain-containing protein [Mariprofundaceae bacterium]